MHIIMEWKLAKDISRTFPVVGWSNKIHACLIHTFTVRHHVKQQTILRIWGYGGFLTCYPQIIQVMDDHLYHLNEY